MKTTSAEHWIDLYFDLHQDELTPEKRHALAMLPPRAIEQAHAAYFAVPTDNDELRAQMRRNVPALTALSDAQLDLALGAAMKLFAEQATNNDEQWERIEQIARWVD